MAVVGDDQDGERPDDSLGRLVAAGQGAVSGTRNPLAAGSGMGPPDACFDEVRSGIVRLLVVRR